MCYIPSLIPLSTLFVMRRCLLEHTNLSRIIRHNTQRVESGTGRNEEYFFFFFFNSFKAIYNGNFL